MGLGSGTPMANQANAVLNALTEGTVAGMFQGIKAVCPGSSDDWIIAKMRSLLAMPDEELDYWLSWLGLKK